MSNRIIFCTKPVGLPGLVLISFCVVCCHLVVISGTKYLKNMSLLNPSRSDSDGETQKQLHSNILVY